MWGILSLIFGFIEILVGLRFVFFLLGADVSSEFVAWVYNVSNPLIAPFGTVFGHRTETIIGTIPGSYFETASLVALIVYGLIGGVLLRVTTNSRGN